MVITKKLTEQITEQLKIKELVAIPASEKEYLELAQTIPFKIEYHNCEIITMGLASFWHETLVMNLGLILNNLFLNAEDIFITGSNTGVQIQKFEGGYYMPDVLVVKGSPQFKENSKCIITNPFIIVEVLSDSTTNFDKNDKLQEYQTLESLQHIIFVSQKKVSVSTYTRTDKPNTWINQNFREITESFSIGEDTVLIKDIYRKIQFS
jgi:Uma2 family endonuclease